MKILVTGGTGTLEADVVVHLAGGQKGDDAVPPAWSRTKHACEQAVEASGIPFTILRAAQFHDLTLTMVRGLAKLPVVPVPGQAGKAYRGGRNLALDGDRGTRTWEEFLADR